MLSLVESSCFGGESGGGPGGNLAKLARQLVGYHFCQVWLAGWMLILVFIFQFRQVWMFIFV